MPMGQGTWFGPHFSCGTIIIGYGTGQQTGSSEFTTVVINHQNERLMFFSWFSECYLFIYIAFTALNSNTFPFKCSHSASLFLVTCAVVQRSPYGFHTASSCFWDTTSDGKRLCMCMVSHFSPVRLFVTPWTVAHRVPLSTGFPRQEYWSGLPFPSPGDLPAPGI